MRIGNETGLTMTYKLDDDLAYLKARPALLARDLADPVRMAIDCERRYALANRNYVPISVAGIVGALILGWIGGSFAATSVAARPHEFSVFSVNAYLAPSTLLDNQR